MVIKKRVTTSTDEEEEQENNTNTKKENVSVTTVEESKDIASENKDIVSRRFIFPLLAEGINKLGRNYPDDQHKAQESEWTEFKNKTDFSIPVKRTVTKIVRIRTMQNKEQALGEYIYYYANLQGSQKHYAEGKLESYPSSEASDVPFGMDIKKNLQPSYKNGQLAGYEDKGDSPFYSEKFTPEGIDTIVENSTPHEDRGIEYSVVDTGSNYGNFTKEEIQQCKLNRLIFRNSNRLNGTEIKDEDKIK